MMTEAPVSEYEVAIARLQASQNQLVALLRTPGLLDKNQVGEWAVEHNTALAELVRSLNVILSRAKEYGELE